MKTFALLSLVAIARAGSSASGGSSSASSSSSSTSAAPTAAALPSDLSSSCQTFMKTLDTDSSLQSCLSPLLSATAPFTPGASPSSSDISSALSTVCSSSTQGACPDSLFRTQLTAFYSACQNELTGSETYARTVYDTLYFLAGFKTATCAVDSSASGQYCVQTLATAEGSSSSSLVSLAKSYIASSLQAPFVKRAAATLQPNATTFQAASVPFMFISTSSSKDVMCSACAAAVVKPYVAFEQSMAYAFGLTNSQLLGGQKALTDAMSSQCGPAFLGGMTTNAGSDPNSVNNVGSNLAGGAMSLQVSVGGVLATLIAAFAAL